VSSKRYNSLSRVKRLTWWSFFLGVGGSRRRNAVSGVEPSTHHTSASPLSLYHHNTRRSAAVIFAGDHARFKLCLLRPHTMLVPHSAPSSLPLRSRVAGWRLPGPAPAPARFVAQPRHGKGQLGVALRARRSAVCMNCVFRKPVASMVQVAPQQQQLSSRRRLFELSARSP
jgi:hypothetical protein